MMADADVQVSIGAKLDELNSGLNEAKGTLDDFGSSLGNIAALAGISFSVAGLKRLHREHDGAWFSDPGSI